VKDGIRRMAAKSRDDREKQRNSVGECGEGGRSKGEQGKLKNSKTQHQTVETALNRSIIIFSNFSSDSARQGKLE